MEAWEIKDTFGIDELSRCTRPDPALEQGQVRVRVKAVSLNHHDLFTIKQGMPGNQLPLIPCSDGAGEVVEIGSGVSRVKEGDRVAGIFFQSWLLGDAMPAGGFGTSLGGGIDGMLADQIVLHEDGLVHIPEHMTYKDASTLPCAAVTAWHGLVTKGKLKAGDTILALGTGGVSIFALQLGVMTGARVIITSSSDEKLARARGLGAWETINYSTTPEWAERALELTGGAGVDHVVEVGGVGTLEQSFQAARVGGTVTLIGVLTGFTDKINPYTVLNKGLRVQGIYVGSREMFETMNSALSVNQTKPVIDRVFPFDEAREALRYFESAAHVGKIVIGI